MASSTGPVLCSASGEATAGRAEVRELVLDWLPHAEDVVIAGADHFFPMTHASDVADAIARFLRRHPLAHDR
jgi:pimeloyl-ACP methyl ester carboxylesterase